MKLQNGEYKQFGATAKTIKPILVSSDCTPGMSLQTGRLPSDGCALIFRERPASMGRMAVHSDSSSRPGSPKARIANEMAAG